MATVVAAGVAARVGSRAAKERAASEAASEMAAVVSKVQEMAEEMVKETAQEIAWVAVTMGAAQATAARMMVVTEVTAAAKASQTAARQERGRLAAPVAEARVACMRGGHSPCARITRVGSSERAVSTTFDLYIVQRRQKRGAQYEHASSHSMPRQHAPQRVRVDHACVCGRTHACLSACTHEGVSHSCVRGVVRLR